MNDSLIKIDPKLVDQLVKEHIHVAVAEALSKNSTALIEVLTSKIIFSRVDGNGEVQSYERHNTQTWLDYAIAKELKTSILEVIQEQVKALRPEIEKSVRANFVKSSNSFAKAVVEGVATSLKWDWNFKLTVGSHE